MHILAELSPLDTAGGSRVTLRAASAQDRRITALNGARWWPAIVEMPSLGIRLFDGDFSSSTDPGSASLAVTVEKLAKLNANARRFLWAGAPLKLYAGNAGDAWASWELVFDGVVDRFEQTGSLAKLQASVRTEPFETSALTLSYAGTGGIEGGDDLKTKVKPWVFGRALNVEPILIDAVNSVYQFSAYGPIQAVNALYERASDFGASVGDYADYAALVAATIPAGRWATCLAQGLIRLGAPAYGVITGDVDGDKPGGTWIRKTGAIISRIAANAGISTGAIDTASLAALDVAVPRNVNIVLTEQTTVMDIARRLARPCNAQAGVSWLGKLFVTRVAVGTPTLTLDAQGRQRPAVLDSVESDVSPPYWRIEMGAAKCWRVHTPDEIATESPLRERGAYDGATWYVPGNWVTYQGSTWRYRDTATPGSGHAPPTLPTTINTWWEVMAKAGDDGQTFYTWIAYSDAADGSVNFTNGAPGDRKFIGIAANKTTATESSTPSDYTWSQYAGPPGFGLVNFANMNIAGNKITKVSGGAAWNASVYSSEAWVGGAYLSFKVVEIAAAKMVGLNTDPTTDANYTGIDYLWYCQYGMAYTRAPGAGANRVGAPIVVGDVLSIHYDGATVRFYKNGVLIDSIAASSGLKLYLDSSFNEPTGTVEILGFGPAGAVGADGLSIAELTVYRRATSAPATPTGGSYNFATKALTAPSGWTATIPAGNDPLYEATGTAAVQGTTGTATPTWAGVGLRSQDGTGANMIFRRSATQPATPAASAGVPASWYDSTGSVPAGADPIWTSFGTRPNAGANWTWQTAKRVEGEDGISPVSIAISPNTATVQLAKDGTIKSGQLPLNFVVTAMQGGSVIPLTSLTINASSGGTWSEDDTKITLSALSDVNAEAQFTAVAGGQSVVGVIAVSTAQDGAGGASISLDTAASLTIANQTSYTQVGGTIAINVSSAGKLKVNFYGMLKPDTVTGYQWQSKIQYSLTGGSSWVDVSGSAKDSSPTFELDVPPFGMRGGTLSSADPITVSGLTADAPALVRGLVQRKSGSATASGAMSGTLTLYAEQAL